MSRRGPLRGEPFEQVLRTAGVAESWLVLGSASACPGMVDLGDRAGRPLAAPGVGRVGPGRAAGGPPRPARPRGQRRQHADHRRAAVRRGPGPRPPARGHDRPGHRHGRGRSTGSVCAGRARRRRRDRPCRGRPRRARLLVRAARLPGGGRGRARCRPRRPRARPDALVAPESRGPRAARRRGRGVRRAAGRPSVAPSRPSRSGPRPAAGRRLGRRGPAWTVHLDGLRDGFGERQLHRDPLELVVEPWGDEAWARGAASLVLRELFHPAHLRDERRHRALAPTGGRPNRSRPVRAEEEVDDEIPSSTARRPWWPLPLVLSLAFAGGAPRVAEAMAPDPSVTGTVMFWNGYGADGDEIDDVHRRPSCHVQGARTRTSPSSTRRSPTTTCDRSS